MALTYKLDRIVVDGPQWEALVERLYNESFIRLTPDNECYEITQMIACCMTKRIRDGLTPEAMLVVLPSRAIATELPDQEEFNRLLDCRAIMTLALDGRLPRQQVYGAVDWALFGTDPGTVGNLAVSVGQVVFFHAV